MAPLSLAQRWEELRPVITHLYLNEGCTLSQVVERIKDEHGFSASPNHYKYQFKKWKLRRSVPADKKDTMLRHLEHRALSGKATRLVYNGKDVDKKKLRRHVQAQTKKALSSIKKEDNSRPTPSVSFSPGIFMNWNMPYGALRSARSNVVSYPSPDNTQLIVSPASDLQALTPRAGDGVSPSANSPDVTKALDIQRGIERASFFIQGKHEELIRSMSKREQATMSTWLYQFWLFAFTTARYWGKGPRNWTAELLDLDKHLERLSLSQPATPAADIASPGCHATPRNHPTPGSSASTSDQPSDLCNWGIHVPGIRYEAKWSAENDGRKDKWAEWPDSAKRRCFADILRDGLESNDFSNLDATDLPIALPMFLRKAQRKRDDIVEEALGFSIMGRNVDLMFELFQKVENAGIDGSSLFPFHLATSYLSGCDPCCNVLCCLVYHWPFSLSQLYRDRAGHTVLDNLMIVIVKAHTDCVPGDVDNSLKHERRFPGEEVDICGRWDADSDCIRALLARGHCRIPFSWKHKFCHTSIQAICHCIATLFGTDRLHDTPNINTTSGLFVNRCEHCGLKLEPLPLHTLVMVAALLAQRGCEGEDLFGMIACLLALLCKGANPALQTHLSPSTLFQNTSGGDACDHESLDPLELAEKLPRELFQGWTEKVKTGWQVFCLVLRIGRDTWAPQRSKQRALEHQQFAADNQDDPFMYLNEDAMDIDQTVHPNIEDSEEAMSIDEELVRICEDCGNPCYFRGNSSLRDLWAAVQAEFASYRRLAEGDPWMSTNFKLDEMLKNYEAGHGLRIGLIENYMLNKYCDCGLFMDADNSDCACVTEVSRYYFCNMEDFQRTTFLMSPEKPGLFNESDEDIEYASDQEDSDDSYEF